jgi:hypothetical protein
MAEMKYVYEYCAAFQDEVDETRRKVDELAADYYDGSDLRRRILRGDQTRANQSPDTAPSRVSRGGWRRTGRDFPDRWPWL